MPALASLKLMTEAREPALGGLRLVTIYLRMKRTCTTESELPNSTHS
jgi:hypothetical protein